MQGTQARPLVWEIPHAVEQHAIGLGLCAATMCVPICSGTLELQLLRPVCLGPALHNRRSHHNEKSRHQS